MNTDPLCDRLTVRHSAAIQRRIQQLLEHNSWTQKEFAQKLGKKEPQISRMLNKPHNFTLRSIAEMEEVFGLYILNTDPKQFGIKARTRSLLPEIEFDLKYIEDKWISIQRGDYYSSVNSQSSSDVIPTKIENTFNPFDLEGFKVESSVEHDNKSQMYHIEELELSKVAEDPIIYG
jgi:transcriptional regulator with XRE-family HTH domain